MRLSLEAMEQRDQPANLIPGWTGAEQVVHGDVNGDLIDDTIVVAQEGGSARVHVIDGKTSGLGGTDGKVLGDFIGFNADFRGGANAFAVPSSPGLPAEIALVPGPGGGPRVQMYQFHDDGFTITSDVMLPYAESFRGGLQVSAGPVSAIGGPNDLFFLPGEGGGPQLVVMDPRTMQVVESFYVGPTDDRSGQYGFEPTGGSVTDLATHEVSVAIQHGSLVDDYQPTEVWGLTTHEDYGG